MAVTTQPLSPPSGATPAPGGRRSRGATSGIHGSRWTPYLFLAPFLLLFVTFVAVPGVLGIWISLHDWDFLLPNKPFVGAQNYADLLDSGSPQFQAFWNGMKATGIFVVISVPFLVVLPLLLAILLNRRFPGRTFFRAVFFAPFVLGVAVVGLMWRYLLDPSFGMVNGLLGALGLPGDTAWTTEQPWAWISLAAVTVWWTIGFNAVIYLAGLADIPAEHYEAAEIDGATAWQKPALHHDPRPATGPDLRRRDDGAGERQHVRPEPTSSPRVVRATPRARRSWRSPTSASPSTGWARPRR